MKNGYALYKMENNKYLGNCFAIVKHFDRVPNGFTGADITILIKPSDEMWDEVESLEDLLIKEDLFGNTQPYLRVGSECMLGVMGDSHCNCEEERIAALKEIGRNSGVYIHMPQEAQGRGLFYKAKELHLQVHGYMPDGSFVGCKSQAEAARLLTGMSNIDVREYDLVANIMKDLDLDGYTYSFMSRNPNKVKSLRSAGINVTMYDIATHMNADNMGEYLTKWIVKGYCFTNDEVVQLVNIIKSDICIPKRAQDLLSKAAEMLTTDEGSAYLQKHLYTSEDTKTELFDMITDSYLIRKAV